jgi:selenocysteine-specific elongation factor
VHWVIGTAGHIDHGKTSLVLALTGTDTDRLKEEKERGISIDLGFASLELPDGTRAGVVDVPGHERFIKNMLAGAHGLDLVLFTVAADDGIMPQTWEHFDIVRLLGVDRAVFVLTKADLVAAPRLDEVADDVRTLVAGTPLDGSAIVPFSARTLAGLEGVRGAIGAALRDRARTPPPGRFRLPVDRTFLSAGHGLVVTGTAISGSVGVGDRVRCLPSGELLRVRNIEVHGAPVTHGQWGQRLALNLSGAATQAIARGDVIGDEATSLTSDRFDAIVEVRPSEPRGLADHQPVRLHVGTAERLGKIVPLGVPGRGGQQALAPGERGFCQVTLREPVAAMRGDRFIVRDETGQRTLGGGVILLAAAPRRRRADPALMEKLGALSGDDDGALFERVIADSGDFVLPLARLSQLLNDSDDRVRARASGLAALRVFESESDSQYATAQACAEVRERTIAAVRAWHAAQPLSAGLDIEEARAGLPGHPPARVFRLLVEAFEAEGALVREGSLLRLPTHRASMSSAEQAIGDRIAQALTEAPLAPPDVKQLGERLQLDRGRLLGLLRALEREGRVVAVASDLYFMADVVRGVRDQLVRDLGSNGTLTTAAFRDRHGTTRKYTIPLLEYLDRQGVTVRIGDVRRLRHPAKKT